MTEPRNPATAYPATPEPLDIHQMGRAVGDLDLIGPPPAPSPISALERLGAPPFPKGKFPFLGFLASIYDHVAERVNSKNP